MEWCTVNVRYKPKRVSMRPQRCIDRERVVCRVCGDAERRRDEVCCLELWAVMVILLRRIRTVMVII